MVFRQIYCPASLTLALICNCLASNAAEYTAKLVEPEKSLTQGAGGLKWKEKEFPVEARETVDHPSRIIPVAVLQGERECLDCKLDVKEEGVTVSIAEKIFKLEIPLDAPTIKITLISTDLKGNIEEEPLVIEFEMFQEWVTEHRNQNVSSVSPFRFSTSLSYTLQNYKQTFYADLAQRLLTMKFSESVSLFLPPWDLDLGGFFTLLPISTNQEGVSARFLGLNARCRYKISQIKEPWDFRISMGVYFSAMFVSGSRLGYTPLLFPQIYPSISRILSPKDSISLYIKYVPLNFSSLGEMELATGLLYSRYLQNQHPLSLSFDFSTLNFRTTTGISIFSQSISFGLGYGL